MNRNPIEDGITVLQLREAGASLVSATESIDETPVGQLMHGILATINEFRSAEDGADIRYKMGQKAKNGGTVSHAPIGYRNVRIDLEGRQINTVEVDPHRAPLITRAFELYATGEYTIDELRRLLAGQGLPTRPTARHPSETLSVSKVRAMLESPYYAGMVVYQGETFAGRHSALIDAATFERVRGVIQSRSKPGQRDRVLFHYLKGLLFCDRCHKAGRTYA